MKNKIFSASEQNTLAQVIEHRRDIRGNNFTNKPVPQILLDKILHSAYLAPSVGLSQPWEFVLVENKGIKEKIYQHHLIENKKAQQQFTDEKQQQYKQLKLEGIKEAPINLAVFYKPSSESILGQNSMPEMGEYSVVCAIQNMWLTARALNIGIGWVSILNPEFVKEIVNAPAENKLIAYLCIGYVKEFLDSPELAQLHWRQRKSLSIFTDGYPQNIK